MTERLQKGTEQSLRFFLLSFSTIYCTRTLDVITMRNGFRAKNAHVDDTVEVVS